MAAGRAWRCKSPNGSIAHDCEDDGESAAGGRLAHLLELMDLDNVLVVVSRWFGGIHLSVLIGESCQLCC